MTTTELIPPPGLNPAAFATVDTQADTQLIPGSYAVNGLDDLQIGHLRHIENLATQPDGDWSHMGNADPGQEWLDSYRYQLAMAAYTLGLAHLHRLPAAPCVFQPVFDSLMRKMLRRDVWGYWKDTSQSGKFINPDLAALRDPWIDPVVKENIMYSGHLHAMAGMYAVLFNDDRYAQPGALTFTHAPIFWGMGPQKFEYDFQKLNDVIYWQMVESGWLGVPCEPNCVFLICNQYPMLGFRFHDLRHGSAISEEATSSYKDAWTRKGMLDKDGHFYYFWRMQQDNFFSVGRASSDAWLGAAMHAWNPDLVRSQYPRQSAEWFHRHADGRVSLLAPTVVAARRAAADSGVPVALQDTAYRWTAPEFGYAAMWASELGDEETLQGLLAHADACMEPTWEKGGLYYPRQDASWDGDGNMIYMDPLTGNTLLAYARLNVPGGLMHLYRQPFDEQHFAQPAMTDMQPRLNVKRAVYDPERGLLLTVGGRRPVPTLAHLTISNAPVGKAWSLWRDGVLKASSDAVATGDTVIEQRGDQLIIHCTVLDYSELRIHWE
ncbi:linalool dehydratase/isomerase domain-containing protein [Undibacterium terreum]|uniref:Linalool dehydratase/isomerase domain-containing protein n=1 Tax=Undibacterium terreum TaxID=1224302 RepID=A0A916XBY3_9BURK|nr:hypothetical protein [Undibacterium terreum]GGC60537.1 hypothetical protein GCM10011396_04290 [Undibacterium terreum]